MAVLPPKGKTVDRRPSMKGKIMQDVSNGAERSRAWPRDRGKSLHPKTKEQMEWFRQAQWATKYMDPKMLVSFKEATAGTPLLPRDMATMMFAGRLFMFDMLDGRKIYSVQVLKDVSESLDVISQTPGFQLVRGPVYWEGVQRIVGGRIGAIVTRTAASASFASNATGTIIFTAETIDQGAFWSLAAPTRIIIPQAGWYNFTFESTRSGTGNFSFDLLVWKNGVLFTSQRGANLNSSAGAMARASIIDFCAAGDYYELKVVSYGAAATWSASKVVVVGNA